MSEVVDLNFVAGRDTSSETILSKALTAKLQHCVVVGWDKSGDLFFSSSLSAGGRILILLERAKVELLNMTSGDAA